MASFLKLREAVPSERYESCSIAGEEPANKEIDCHSKAEHFHNGTFTIESMEMTSGKLEITQNDPKQQSRFAGRQDQSNKGISLFGSNTVESDAYSLDNKIRKEAMTINKILDKKKESNNITPELMAKLLEELKMLNQDMKKKYDILDNFFDLGAGAQGTVSQIYDPSKSIYYARKEEKKGPNDFNFDQKAWKQIRILMKIIQEDDPSLIKIYSIDYQPG